jgi:hypothetical protein
MANLFVRLLFIGRLRMILRQKRSKRTHRSAVLRLLFLFSGILVGFSVSGCPRPDVPRPQTEPKIIEPNVIEWPVTEPSEVGAAVETPGNAESVSTEPDEAQAVKAEPNVVDANKPDEPAKVTFHEKCASVFAEFVDDEGMVDYRRLKLNWLGVKKVRDEFAKLDFNEYRRWPEEDKIAFWINAYNIQLLRIIIDNYPIESFRLLRVLPGWGPASIRHIDKRIGGIKQQKFTIMNEEFSLGKIEDRFFKKEFDEPRVFLAVSQATVGGPPLRKEPYTGEKLSEQLDDQVSKFLANPKAFRIDRAERAVYLSLLFHPTWYGSEFVEKYRTDKRFKDELPVNQAVLNLVTQYISDADRSFLEKEIYTVRHFKYFDWRLNDASSSR